jgi:gliding motility-associated-like protein
LMATGATDYVWSPGTALSSVNTDTSTATPITTITYTVTGTSSCITGPAQDTVKITVLTAAALNVNAGSDQDICALPFNLTGSTTGGFGANSYAWTVVDGSIVDTIQNHTSVNASVAPTQESINTYQLMITDFCGDTASDYVTVNVIMDCKLNIPNVFTPNGDGRNDEFIVTGIGMKTYSVSIFDRWGKKVYESSDIKESWNGKNGDDGTYYYMIKAESLNGKKFDEKGYLLRLGNK